MTVAELIERLKEFDGNLIVMGEDYEEGFYGITDVISGHGTVMSDLAEPDRVVLR